MIHIGDITSGFMVDASCFDTGPREIQLLARTETTNGESFVDVDIQFLVEWKLRVP